MSHERFDKLRERLLRAGIAPRHVRRYVSELRDHFEDLVREGTEKGLTRDEAQEAARQRIGNEDALAHVMLARPGLRSVTARFPWATFGLGPVFMLVLVVAGALLVQSGMIFWNPEMPPWSVPWARFSFDALDGLAMYVAPLLIAATISIIGIRQRMTAGWIVLGLAVICSVGGFHEIGVRWSAVPSQPNGLYVGFGLAPPFPRQMIVSGLLRAAINAALAGGAYWLWLHRTGQRMSYSP